jgi:hypothetical protein
MEYVPYLRHIWVVQVLTPDTGRTIPSTQKRKGYHKLPGSGRVKSNGGQ